MKTLAAITMLCILMTASLYADKTCIKIDETITICTDDITGEDEIIYTTED